MIMIILNGVMCWYGIHNIRTLSVDIFRNTVLRMEFFQLNIILI